MLRSFAFLACVSVVTAPAAAQSIEYLTRAELEAHLQSSALCYYPSGRLSCAWAEMYTEFFDDHTILQSANAVWPEPMSVMEFRIEWEEDALCVDPETHGLLALREADGYRFPFDLEGLRDLPADGIPALVAQFNESASGYSCFRYSNDPINPGQLLQHVFYDGVAQPNPDPIALIPHFAGGVAIEPSG